MVDLIDTNGVKPTLKKGVLGYDDYNAGGDVGRLYVGTGTASIAQAKKSELDSHTSNVSNPHSVTKTQIGLGNVDNTSDVNKPVSTATQTALNTKVNKITSTDNAVVRFNGTTGEVQNSGVIIDDNNNVGIWVTPSVWGGKAIETIGGSLFSNGSTSYIAFTQNTYYDGANWRYKNNGQATIYSQQNGAHYWFTSPSGVAGNVAAFVNTLALDTGGNLLLTSGTGGLGYGYGAGGTVTQLTSKSTAVTLNKPTGQITMNNAALAAGSRVDFFLNNSLISTNDSILLCPINNGDYEVKIAAILSGKILVRVTNVTGTSKSESLIISFAIIKGATA